MKLTLTRNQIIIVAVAGFIALIISLMFFGVIPVKKTTPGGGWGIGGDEGIKISLWGIADSEILKGIIDEYQKINKGVSVEYVQFSESEYERALVNALAAGRGPDIFTIHNTWLAKHFDKIMPLAEAQLPFAQFRQLYPTVVEQDFVIQSQERFIIFGMPLYLDTLALLYNRDFFDAKAIALAPRVWQDLNDLIPKLRELNPQTNEIIKAGAAIGGSEYSVNKAADLLALLMLQAGAAMYDPESRRVDFGEQGINALNFYVQFANPLSANYTWSDNFRNSLDSFSEGKTAIIFNYASAIPFLKAKNPFLSIGVSPMLQLNRDRPINYANYWGLTTSKYSQQPALAWNFILYLTANPKVSEQFLKAARLPPALRVLINQYLNDPDLGVFSRQALTSRSWHQVDSSAIKRIFSNMIQSILSGQLTSDAALKKAENEINNLTK
jgi:ABC-type glycerol-3-phosphate transport system substrate-binding protein